MAGEMDQLAEPDHEQEDERGDQHPVEDVLPVADGVEDDHAAAVFPKITARL